MITMISADTLSDFHRVPAFRLTVLILVVVSQFARCIHGAPSSDVDLFLASNNHIQDDTLENTEILTPFEDEVASQANYQTYVNSIVENRGGEKEPRRLALYWRHLATSIRKSIAPTLEYLDLLNRYHSWYRKYTALERATGGSIKKAMQVMREEYAKANELLMAEDCPLEERERDYENMDFVYRALKVVINDLEKILSQLEEKKEMLSINGGQQQQQQLIVDDGVNEESINRAMERVKRTTIKTAKEVLKKEAFILAKMVAVNAATFYLQGAIAESAIDSLAPLIGMLSSGDISLASAYLRDLELRAALSVLHTLNPIPHLRCDSQSKMNGKEKSE